MLEELKPCPFCGGKAEIQPEGITTPDEAVQFWNRRINDEEGSR